MALAGCGAWVLKGFVGFGSGNSVFLIGAIELRPYGDGLAFRFRVVVLGFRVMSWAFGFFRFRF